MNTNVQFVRFNKAGELRKLGFTQPGERTDGLTKANIKALADAMHAGKLEDREGNKVTNGAWVKCWAYITDVQPKVDSGVDDEFECASGIVAVNIGPASATDESAPFDA